MEENDIFSDEAHQQAIKNVASEIFTRTGNLRMNNSMRRKVMTNKTKSSEGLAPEIGSLLNNHLIDDLKESLISIKSMQTLLARGHDEDTDLDTSALIYSSASLADFALLTLSCIETNMKDLMTRGISNEMQH